MALPWRLLAHKDKVCLVGLTSEAGQALNGKQGSVVAYHPDRQRYQIAVDGGDETIAAKRTNLELVSPVPASKKTGKEAGATQAPKMHVLIPCHFESNRRLVTFMRCVGSIASQTTGGFCVFVGISGGQEWKDQCTSFLTLLASKSNHAQWHLLDDSVEQRSQFEHLRHLLPLSEQESPDAWLMFADSDDMFHPCRIQMFQSIVQDPGRPGGPFNVPCKLLLDETVSAKEGKMDRLIANAKDFNKWSKDATLRRKITVAGAEDARDLDADEFFDFCVPTSALREFMELTPVEITKSVWCDLRFQKMLEHQCVIKALDVGVPWLLAHYKIRLEAKFAAFDAAGQLEGGQGHMQDQASMTMAVTAEDKELAAKYGKLEAGQVAICRSRVDSATIQCCMWNPKGAAFMQEMVVGDLDQLYGKGLGAELWQRSTARFEEQFSREQADRNKLWRLEVERRNKQITG